MERPTAYGDREPLAVIVTLESAAGPAGFSLVEEISDDPNAIAAVATVGYTGFVWSPPLLGWIADTVDLRAAMAVVVLATLGITATGLFAREKGTA